MQAHNYPRPQWFTDVELRNEATLFLNDFWPSAKIPVNIARIVDVEAELDVVETPGIFRAYGIDGYLSDDMTAIYVDADLARGTTLHRLRFTLAHEVAHWYLHEPLYAAAAYSSPQEFLDFRRSLPARDLASYEWQASQFAGLILVPSAALVDTVGQAVEMAHAQGFGPVDLNNVAHREYLAEWVGRRLEVSAQVILRRGSADGLWPLA